MLKKILLIVLLAIFAFPTLAVCQGPFVKPFWGVLEGSAPSNMVNVLIIYADTSNQLKAIDEDGNEYYIYTGDPNVSLTIDIIDPNHLADADWGDFSVSSGSATLDPNTVGASELASGAYTDVSISAAGAITLDNDVVGPAELADGDYGDVLMSSGAITVDPNATPTVTDLIVTGDTQIYGRTVATKTDNYTVTIADFGKTIRLNSTSNKTFTLPSVAAAQDSKELHFQNINTGRLTLDASDTDYVANSGAGDGIYTNSDKADITLQYCHTDTMWRIKYGVGPWVTYD